MALSAAEQVAKANGWAMPDPADYVRDGDDAIRTNALKTRDELARVTAQATALAARTDAIADQLAEPIQIDADGTPYVARVSATLATDTDGRPYVIR